MKSIYLIVSSDYITIKQNITWILKDNNLTNDNVIKYDLIDTSIDKVVEELDTFNFLVDRKVVVASNCLFLSGGKVKNMIEQNTLSLEKYINNPNLDNILILVTEKLDERKNIVKLLKKKAEIIDKDVPILEILKKQKEGFKVDDYTLKYLIDYCNNDNEKIVNEFNKLKLFKCEEKMISMDDIDVVVMKSLEDNIFSLLDAITSRKKKKALKIYLDLVENREDSNKILAMVMDQFRMIYKGKILAREKMRNDQIAKTLGIHPYRFQKAMEKASNYTTREILEILNTLSDIDIKTKSGKSNLCSFEAFIMSL